jgi:hypothetical protein
MSGITGTTDNVPAAVIGEVELPTSAAIIGNNYASSGSAQGLQGMSDDLFLDKNKRLWFCKGGTAWRQLA